MSNMIPPHQGEALSVLNVEAHRQGLHLPVLWAVPCWCMKGRHLLHCVDKRTTLDTSPGLYCLIWLERMTCSLA